ncbi:hypothetical protein [Streptomyces sp. NPDC053048]|uniref:hypothetical protein n=1 Tax=Streptomyces sp. NPDC053048 TaxID=3365694 RepID=UPI0037D8EFC1
MPEIAFDPAVLELNDDQVLTTLREVVAESPHYVYSPPQHQDRHDCYYVHTSWDGTPESPGCVVGVVLHRLGVPLEYLAQYEGWAAMRLLDSLPVALSARTINALENIQCAQDNGRPWGEAYTDATGKTI